MAQEQLEVSSDKCYTAKNGVVDREVQIAICIDRGGGDLLDKSL